MAYLFFSLPGCEALAAEIATKMCAQVGKITVRRFPDGESYVRLLHPVADSDVVIVCRLNQPDAKVVPLLWAAAAAREGGAASVGLVTPCLPYMRQDKVFSSGETVSARHFAALLSSEMNIPAAKAFGL
ncbi:ribose-phosphate pyrophosphokinase-like domain-containing protein [Cupriavidus pauculus]|uniref:ribose-phosphate pyrophosphokinase-like domain-containing protein n=1 Tax=Cupriavidus pauculus TaxID=82633 RepID=UPI000782772D|nr:ribose-phosphate pyrophosphokinase-like domain-containing protein [Cupriavidus pauculus]